jgi:hypothetical protein
MPFSSCKNQRFGETYRLHHPGEENQRDMPFATGARCEKILISISSLRASVDSANMVRFEVFTAVTMKNCVFWDITPCGSCKNRRLGGN